MAGFSGRQMNIAERFTTPLTLEDYARDPTVSDSLGPGAPPQAQAALNRLLSSPGRVERILERRENPLPARVAGAEAAQVSPQMLGSSSGPGNYFGLANTPLGSAGMMQANRFNPTEALYQQLEGLRMNMLRSILSVYGGM